LVEPSAIISLVFLNSLTLEKVVKIEFKKTNEMMADGSTKPLNGEKFYQYVRDLNVKSATNVDVAGLSVAGLSIGEILNGHLGMCPLEKYMS